MRAGIALREDYDAAQLRSLAKATRNAGQSRRLLALAEICRVGGGRAFALPPSARSNGSCGFPASRFPVWSSPLTGNAPDPRHQMDQPDQSELVHQTSGGIMPPRRV